MKAHIEEINSVQKRIKIECGKDDVNSAFDTVFRDVRKKAKIHGFRPGKAPLGMIKNLYGDSIAAEVADKLIRQYLFTAIQEHSVEPISQPVLEANELPQQDKVYSFSAVVDLMPQIELTGYTDLDLSFKPVEVNDQAVEAEIKGISRQQAKTQSAEEGSAAKEGQMVEFDQEASHEGKEISDLNSKGNSVELGEGQMLPALEEAIIGMKVGDEKDAKISLPEAYNDKDLAGKEITLKIKLNSLQDVILPTIDDEFAKDLGLESLDELKTKVQERLNHQAETSKRNQLEAQIFEKVGAVNNFEVPPAIVDQVIDSMITDATKQMDEKQQREMKQDHEYRDQLKEDAKVRSRNTLILHEIIKSEKLEVSDEDIEANIQEMFAGSGEDIDAKVMESIKKSFNQQQKENLLFRKAIDFVIGKSKITEKFD